MATVKSSIETVYLVDASIYIFQAHFSPYVECADSKGNDLSALYGFAQFLLQFLRRAEPAHLAVALDESLFCGFRHEMCPNYKSNRELPDENLALQLNACAEICALFGLATFASKKYEADDIIGTLAQRVRKQSTGTSQVHIVSKDKDLAQLLENPKDCLWDYSSNRKRFWKDIVRDFGVTPTQIPDLLGLTGDAVDCISGVPGVGPVKAKELLRHFHSLEGVYANLDKVAALPVRGASRLHDLLEEHQALAELSKSLATIVCNVDEPTEAFSQTEMAGLEFSAIDLPGFGDFLRHYQFEDTDSKRLLASAEHLQQSRHRI